MSAPEIDQRGANGAEYSPKLPFECQKMSSFEMSTNSGRVSRGCADLPIYQGIDAPICTLMTTVSFPIFLDPRKHDTHQLARLTSLQLNRWQDEDSSKQFADVELAVQHGLPVAREMLRKMDQKADLPPSAKRYLLSLTLQLNAIDQICSPLPYLANRELLHTLYDPDGYVLVEKQGAQRLLVAFATSFNNFYFSNLILLELLQRFDTSILLLKDDSPMSCLYGVKGMGNSFEAIATSIADLVQRRSYDEVLITGYSSGGFPALLLSCMIPFTRLLVFSPKTDFSGAVQADLVPELNRLIFQYVPREQMPVVRQHLEASPYDSPRKVVYGLRSAFDCEHARHIAHVPGVELCAMPDTGHNTVAQLMPSGKLLDCFDYLITGKAMPSLSALHTTAPHA